MNEIKIIQITDLHLNADKSHIAHDINPYNSAQIIINEVIKESKNINSLILTGDLVDDESREGYENLSELLVEAHDKCQIFLMPGNHDSIEEIDKLCKTKNFNNDKYFSINNWIIFMFNTKKNNSPNGILYKKEVDFGTLDVTFYRDDFSTNLGSPEVGPSDITFNINKKNIILIDDVLYTGRTIRAALDELFSFGRPSNIKLGVLVDRGHRELPIKADFIGKNYPTAVHEHVHVLLKEIDNKDEVNIVEY